MVRFNVTYVQDQGAIRQQELMKLASQSSFLDEQVAGLSLFEFVYQKVATEPHLLKVLSFVLPYWGRMGDRDRARWGSNLTNDHRQWDRFYQEHIADCQHCPQDDRLLWMQLVPTFNVDYGDLMRIGHSLECLDPAVLQEIERQCELDSWQRKVLTRLNFHDLSSQ